LKFEHLKRDEPASRVGCCDGCKPIATACLRFARKPELWATCELQMYSNQVSNGEVRDEISLKSNPTYAGPYLYRSIYSN